MSTTTTPEVDENLPEEERELLLRKKSLSDFEDTIRERRQKKKFLSDAIKNCGERIRSEFTHLIKENDKDVRPYVDEFNNLMQNVIEEYALSLDENIDFLDANKMKRTIDVSNENLKQHKQKIKENELKARTQLEDLIRDQYAKIKKQ